MTDTLTARLLAEIEWRHEQDDYRYWHGESTGAQEAMKYLAALHKIVETTAEWRHEVVEDCWYTCAAATDEREGSECCDDSRRGGPCDCGLDYRRGQVLTAIATALDVTP